MPRRLFQLTILLCLPLSLHAQSGGAARTQIYGGYSYLSNSINGVSGSHQPLNGWDASVAMLNWHGLQFKADVFDYRQTSLGAPQDLLYIGAGGQWIHRLGREYGFVEGLIGDGRLNRNWVAGGMPGNTASFLTLVGGGLDTPMTRHLAFRVQGDFQYSNFTTDYLPVPDVVHGLPNYFFRATVGPVWRF